MKQHHWAIAGCTFVFGFFWGFVAAQFKAEVIDRMSAIGQVITLNRGIYDASELQKLINDGATIRGSVDSNGYPTTIIRMQR